MHMWRAKYRICLLSRWTGAFYRCPDREQCVILFNVDSFLVHFRAGHRFQSSDEEEDDSQESDYDDDVDSDGEESDDSEDETEPSTSRREPIFPFNYKQLHINNVLSFVIICPFVCRLKELVETFIRKDLFHQVYQFSQLSSLVRILEAIVRSTGICQV